MEEQRRLLEEQQRRRIPQDCLQPDSQDLYPTADKGEVIRVKHFYRRAYTHSRQTRIFFPVTMFKNNLQMFLNNLI